MNKLLRITNSWTIVILALLLAFVYVAVVHAQETPQDLAKKYGVTFPIAELGGCTDYATCRSYCEDPINQNTCVSFAKSKGFYQEDSLTTKANAILQAAKTTLGCDSVASCQSFCEIPTNYDKCNSFAQSQGISGGHVDDPSKYLDQARTTLGCSSLSSCRDFCSDPANAGKCTDFARGTGLHGGEHQVGPAGCTSEATCRSICSDPNNFQMCSGFTSSSGGTFTGPGGCSSEESCRSFCQQNPQACAAPGGYPIGGPGGPPPPGYNPQDMCNRTPNCSWTGNTCQCGFYGETRESAQRAGEYSSYCQANPDRCRIGVPGSFGSTEQRAEFENYCSQNPEKCRPPGGGTTTGTTGTYGGNLDPAAECAKYGCSWTNNSCQCTGITSGGTGGTPQYSPQPGSYYYPTPGSTYSYPSPTETYSYPSPTGTYSYPSPGSYSYPSPGSYSYPSPTYGTPEPYGTPTYVTPPAYSYPTPPLGVSKELTPWEQFLNWLGF